MNDEKRGPRKSLRDILRGNLDAVAKAFENAEAAPDLKPIPGGTYVAEIYSGVPFQAGTGSPGYKITFRILEGDYQNRHVWLDLWFTDKALKLAKRDLRKLGVTNLNQLEERPLPRGIICKARVALKTDGKGNEGNEVRWFEVIRVEQPEIEPFAVEEQDSQHGDAWEPPTQKDEKIFPPDTPGESGPSTEGQ